MSRYASNGAGNAVAANILNTIAGKESHYLEGLKENHTMCTMMAGSIAGMEKTLPSLLEGCMDNDAESEIAQVMKEYKEALKQCAEKNVQRVRQVQTFCQAVRQVQQQQAGNTSDEIVDYQELINQSMGQAEQAASNMQLDMKQEPFYREVLKQLGEKTTDDEQVEDDEVMIEETQGTGSGGGNLKCPITQMYMEDPVKNKVCGHVYSQAGIQQMLQASRGGVTTCPVAGCTNRQLTMSQLEEDMQTKHLVRREKRRLDRDEQLRASQASDLVDSDEEEGTF